jgi:aminoglycoside 3-N-acetyltransferase
MLLAMKAILSKESSSRALGRIWRALERCGSGDRAKGAISFPGPTTRLTDLLKGAGMEKVAVIPPRADAAGSVVTGILPGECPEDILITACAGGSGADGDLSGCAVGIEAIRALQQAIRSRQLPRLKRTIRLACSMQPRGLQALLDQGWPGGKVVARVHVGADHLQASMYPNDGPASAAVPSCAELILHVLAGMAHRNEPAWRMNGLITGACAYFLAQAGLPEALGLAELAGKSAIAALRKPSQDKDLAGRTMWQFEERLKSLVALVPDIVGIPGGERELRRHLFGPQRLVPREYFNQEASGIRKDVARLAGRLPPTPGPKLPAAKIKALQVMVPRKTFRGCLDWESFSEKDRARLTKQKAGAGVPPWLQHALWFSNGKRDLVEIGRLVERTGETFPWNSAAEVFAILARQKPALVKFRQLVTRQDIIASLRQAGVKDGMILMAHTSLSQFGYIIGGARTMIDALLAVLGPRGTLVMPSHSVSFLGRPPFDPATSPARVGAVGAAFLKHPGVIRSLHPTHSVSALGLAAKTLVSSPIDRLSPLAKEGFWGRLVDAGGHVVLLCPIGSNTIIHCTELWGGVPLPPMTVSSLVRGKRVEYSIPAVPWHGNFDEAHRVLKQRRQLHSAPLGESRIWFFKAADAIEAGLPFMRRDPLNAIPKDCDCPFCRYIRRAAKRTKRTASDAHRAVSAP